VQLVRSLRESPRGSWLRETWAGMRAVAAQPKPGFRDFPVLISDGEVFDVGSDLPHPGAPLRWLPLLGGAGDPTEDFVDAVAEAHLQAALRALAGGAVRWDKSRLAMLAGGGVASFPCPRDGVVSQPGRLSCIRCGSFLLALDPMELDQIHPLRWKFPLMADGG